MDNYTLLQTTPHGYAQRMYVSGTVDKWCFPINDPSAAAVQCKLFCLTLPWADLFYTSPLSGILSKSMLTAARGSFLPFFFSKKGATQLVLFDTQGQGWARTSAWFNLVLELLEFFKFWIERTQCVVGFSPQIACATNPH